MARTKKQRSASTRKSHKSKAYSDRSKNQQKKIDRAIGKSQGDRSHMLRLLREGEWTPFARSPERRLPADYTRNPERYPGIPRAEPINGGGILWRDDLMEATFNAMQRLRDHLRGSNHDAYLKYNAYNVAERIGNMTERQLAWTASASPEEIQAAASAKGANPWHYH